MELRRTSTSTAAGRHRRPDPSWVALPPELGIRPKEYKAFHVPPGSLPTTNWDTASLLGMVAGGAGLVGFWIGSPVAAAVDSGWGHLAGLPIWVLGAVGAVRIVSTYLRVERPQMHATRIRRDEIRRAISSAGYRLVTIDQIPARAQERFKRLVTLANHAEEHELPAALTRLHTEATAMRAGQWRDPLRDVIDTPAPEPATLDPEHKRLLNRAGHDRDLWQRAQSSHDAIRLEWSEILLEPLAVLDHPMLLDVSEPTTASFITAYARVQDFRSVHGEEFNPGRVEEYADLAREAAAAWEQARTLAQEAGVSYLPKAEQVHVRKAMKLLEKAEDEAVPLERRVRAAQRAAELLGKVHSVTMPPEMLA